MGKFNSLGNTAASTFLLMVCTLIAPLRVRAQDPCKEVLLHGPFNTTSISSSVDLATSFDEFIYDANFSTHQEAIDAGIAIGTEVYGVPLQIGGKFSRQQKDTWRSTHQSAKHETMNKAQKYAALTKFASPDILKSWTHCIELTAPTRVGLFGWIEEISSTVANLHVTWNPMAGDNGKDPVVRGSTIVGGETADKQSHVAFPKNSKLLRGASGNIATLYRKASEALVVVINTSRGDICCFMEPPQKPQIANFGASPEEIQEGETASLNWSVSNATELSIDNGIGQVDGIGSARVTPTATTTYRLTASNSSGSVHRLTDVTVLRPVLTSANVSFHVTDNDKDADTRVDVYIKAGGNTIAKWGGTDGHWDNNSDHGPFNLEVSEGIKKENLIGPGQAVLVESPRGHDEWHFNWSVRLKFSDGSSKGYDWTGESVDYDRNTITHPLP